MEGGREGGRTRSEVRDELNTSHLFEIRIKIERREGSREGREGEGIRTEREGAVKAKVFTDRLDLF